MSTIMKNKSLLLLPIGLAIFDCGRDLDQLNRFAAIGPRHLRQLVTGDRAELSMSRNGLLLLIAGLAFLVAIGILTS